MNLETLRRIAQDAARLVPQEIKDQVAATLMDAQDTLTEVIDDLTDARAQSSGSIYDDVREDMGTPPNSFEDIVKGWEYPVSNSTPHAAEQPDAERSESGGTDLSSLIKGIYAYVVENNEDYAGWSKEFEDWNVAHPVYIVIDFLALLAEGDIGQRKD